MQFEQFSNQALWQLHEIEREIGLPRSGVASPKIWWGPKCLILGE